ncbi:putative P-loop ATPase [Flavobacterium lacus]|uniref:Putative P-loop ATPase n=1 Tax=Flavobacterium lacus TaxID=1353778 RepID=A0A328WXC6_9FLAO|nr:putative P-loop ATPase [Flavobacterium lacus]
MMTHNIDKDTIFSQTTAENIFLKFLNLNEFPKGNISSPFSEDKNPSFKVYKNGTFKCFSTHKQGDVMQFVAELYKLDCKSQFQELLKIIATEMNITTYKNLALKKENNTPKITQEESFKIDSIKHIEFNNGHLDFWKKLGVSVDLLIEYNVKAVSAFSFYNKSKDKNYNYSIKNDEVGFSYEINSNHEIYIPEQKNRKKFFCNGLLQNDIFGLEQLSSSVDNIMICAGKKDALVAVSRGFPAVSFRSETQRPTKEHIQGLQKLCKKLFICYDNDKGGEIGTKNIISLFPEISILQIPKSYNDIADYFLENSNDDFQKIIDSTLQEIETQVESENSTAQETITIFHITEDYLNERYDLRYNTISLEIEISKKNENQWNSCNENSLWLELQKKSIKISLNSLIAILKSDAIQKYNPILNYFNSLPAWNCEVDYITEFSKYVILEENENKEQFEYHFKKWCVRAVKCATIDDYFNKQAFVLTDDGLGQNIGKSSWCRFLCPTELSNYLAEDMGDDKDSRILLCKNFLINLDELAALSRKEINQLKSYFSKAQINERLPYDKKNSVIPRVASFIGSTNMSTFLQDETGSVRWLCFVVKSINWNYKKEFTIDNLWAQAFALSNDVNFDETLSSQDIQQNEQRNDKFQIVSPEKDLILKHFAIPTNSNEAEFLTSTDILHHLNLNTSGIRLSSVGIGKALKAIGFKRDKNNQVYGYWVEKKSV